MTLAYVLSLIGPEGLLINLDGLNRHWRPNRNEHITMALLGRVKGETLNQTHLLPCSIVTDSGIDVKHIVHSLLVDKLNFGLKDGPAILDNDGKMF